MSTFSVQILIDEGNMMSKKQKTIMLCFNIVGLIGILLSAYLLAVDVGRIFRASTIFVMGGSTLFSWYGYDDYGWSLTIHNYLLAVALATVIINIVLIVGFSIWNRRRN